MAFQKGQSGNPGGRPKRDAAINGAARKHAMRAIETAVAIMDDDTVAPKTRLAAASLILDRGYGKPAQTIDATISDERDIRDLTTSELARRAGELTSRIDELAARIAGTGTSPDEPADVRQLN